METPIAILIAVALVIYAAVTLGGEALRAVDTVGTCWRQMEHATEERSRTQLSLTGSEEEEAGAVLKVTVANQGSLKLHSFSSWDVLVQYYDSGGGYHIKWLPYTSSADPGANQWTVQGLYLDAPTDAEIFEPGILNPSEELVLKARVSPSAVMTRTLMVVGTPNGVTTSASLTE